MARDGLRWVMVGSLGPARRVTQRIPRHSADFNYLCVTVNVSIDPGKAQTGKPNPPPHGYRADSTDDYIPLIPEACQTPSRSLPACLCRL